MFPCFNEYLQGVNDNYPKLAWKKYKKVQVQNMCFSHIEIQVWLHQTKSNRIKKLETIIKFCHTVSLISKLKMLYADYALKNSDSFAQETKNAVFS